MGDWIERFCFFASFVAIAYPAPSLLSRRREGFGEERPFSGNASLGARVARSGEAIDCWRDHVEDLALFVGTIAARLRRGSVWALDPLELVRPAEAGCCWDSAEGGQWRLHRLGSPRF